MVKQQITPEQFWSDRTLLDTILNSSAVALAVIDCAGKFVFVNQQAEVILGVESSRIIERAYQSLEWQITDASGRPIADEPHPFIQVMQTGQPVYDVHYAIYHASGVRRYLSINAAPTQDSGGRLTGVVLSLSDISDRLNQEYLVDRMAQHIRGSLHLGEILKTTVIEVQHLLNVDRVLIYRLNAKKYCGLVVAEQIRDQVPQMIGWQIHNAAFTQTGNLQVLQSGQVQSIADITQSDLSPDLIQLLQVFHVQSQLAIPIFQTDGIWGLLVVHECRHLRPWKEQDIHLLRRIENQLAIAIQHAELHQKMQDLNTNLEQKVDERTAQLQQFLDFEATLKSISDRVRDSLDEDQILQAAVTELGKCLGADCCNTRIYSEEKTQSTVNHEHRLVCSSTLGQISQIHEEPEVYTQLLQKKVFQFCPRPIQAGNSDDAGITVLACPIFDDQGVLGDIRLYQNHDRSFEELELRLVQQVANQCAIAIRQSRLYQTAQTQVRELEKLNRLKTDFLSTVSHELRTPLCSIKMSTQLMEIMLHQIDALPKETEPITVVQKKFEQCLGILRSECDREIALINDILTLQQLDAGTQPFIPTTLHLQYWLPQVVEAFEEDAKLHHQSISVDISPDLPPMTTDLFMFNRILGELLTNACKFTPAGGAIAVTAQITPDARSAAASPDQSDSPAPRIHIQITNTGVEIPESELDQIFQQFYRIPSSDPWKYGGTGMGLALVKKLVANLNGAIWAESSHGQTRFIVQVPLHKS